MTGRFHIEAEQGRLLLKLGSHFTTPDAERLDEAMRSLAPFSQLVVDFTDVRETQDSAFFLLSEALRRLAKVTVVLRGLTMHQSRLLRYLGLPVAEVRARA